MDLINSGWSKFLNLIIIGMLPKDDLIGKLMNECLGDNSSVNIVCKNITKGVCIWTIRITCLVKTTMSYFILQSFLTALPKKEGTVVTAVDRIRDEVAHDEVAHDEVASG